MALASSDITKIFNGVQKMIDFAVNDLEERISSKINHLPTKEEFYGSMDQIMGELKAIRVASLEKIHPAGTHTTA